MYIKENDESANAIQITQWRIFAAMANDVINLEIYGYIMRTRVFPFIHHQYRERSYYFWPGLAFAHDIWDGLQVLQNSGI